jgi:protein O-mannosyl-transferase
MKKAFHSSPRTIVIAILTASTLLAYWPVQNFNFINFDDNEYVYGNPHVTQGLTLKNIGWAFTKCYSANWHPLTWISHMIDCELFGVKAGGHHLTNLYLHIVNVALLFFLLHLMTGALWRSALVAALMALHPLHVESVAWISERKDVLSAFFLFLTLWAYFRYTRHPSIKSYSIVVVCFAAGLMTKPMLVTVPVILLVLDYWPLNRFASHSINWFGGRLFASGSAAAAFTSLLMEKIPLILLSLASSIVTVLVQRGFNAITPFSLNFKIANAFISYASYCVSMVIPKNLCVLYPWPTIISVRVLIAAVVFLICISLLALRTRRSFPWLAAGWLWYLCTLLPVIGIIQVGVQRKADRYTYIPLIGLFIIIAWGIQALSNRFPKIKTGAIVLACLSLAALAILTRKQVNYWKDNVTLYTHTLHCNPNNYAIHNNFGIDLNARGQTDEALKHLKACLETRPQPRYSSAEFNLGEIYEKKGDLQQAIRYFNEAVRSDSTDAKGYFRLAELFRCSGDDSSASFCFTKSQQYYTQRIHDNPDDGEGLMILGIIMIEKDSLKSAIDYFSKLIRVDPQSWNAYYYLGICWSRRGDFPQTFINYTKSIELCEGASSAPYFRLGVLLFHKGKLHAAKDLFTRSLQVEPSHMESYYNRASVYFLQNEYDSALSDYRTALRLKPGYPIVHKRLADLFTKKGLIDSAAFHRKFAGIAALKDTITVLQEKNDGFHFTGELRK